MSDLTKVADNLNYILNCSASIQHKLTNPVISNSLPTNSSIHSALISITSLLADMSTGNDSATAASEWISNQDWDGVGGSLDVNQQKIETLAARIRSAAFKVQLFRENIEKINKESLVSRAS